MKRSMAMLRLVLKEENINMTSNKLQTNDFEESRTSNNDNRHSESTKNVTQPVGGKENVQSRPNDTVSSEEQPLTRNLTPVDIISTKAHSSSDKDSTSSSGSSSSSSSDSEDSDDSVRDPNFIIEQPRIQSSSESSDLEENIQDTTLTIPSTSTANFEVSAKIPARKRKANPADWKQNKSKLLRNSGSAYTTVKNQQMRGRNMKAPCGDKCRHKCSVKITLEERTHIFEEYWALKDINRQREFINNNMLAIKRKYRYTTTERGRMLNNAFYFNIMDQTIRVCKTFFINTLDINSRVIKTVISKRTSINTIEEDKRGKHNKHHNLPSGVKASVRDHINSIPRIESHYLRNQTRREYIEGGKTISDLYRDYKEDCIKNNKLFANYVMYAKIFNFEFNLGFFVPKKDRCELCVAYENAQDDEKLKLEDKYTSHQHEKQLSRQEKQNDKDKASKKSIVAVFDLQAVLPVPKGEVSVFYYKSKLNCFNFTVTDIKDKKTECYFWHEGDGNRGSDEIGSCLLKFIEKQILNTNEDIDITFYSDNCVGQNKNKFIVALYVFCVLKFKKLNAITHKFLITGHTQNEGDSVHSVIEKNIKRNLKSGPIYVPSQYAQIIKTAKKTGEPYILTELSYEYFISLKTLMSDMRISIGNLKIMDVKVLKYTKETPDVLYYKKSYDESTYYECKLWRKCPQSMPELKAAYERPIPLNERKRTDLMSLVNNNHVPHFYSAFYQHVCQTTSD